MWVSENQFSERSNHEVKDLPLLAVGYLKFENWIWPSS